MLSQLLLLLLFLITSVEGQSYHQGGTIKWIAANPHWIDYGGQTTVTFSFTPPCKSIKFFKQGADGCCHFGRGCWWATTISPRSQVRPTSQFTARNLTHLSNGNYYAICTDDISLYKTEHVFGKNNWSLLIGVKPKIFFVEFVGPDKQLINLDPRKAQSGETFFEGTVFLPPGKVSLVFGVGRGHNPNSTVSHEDFIFYVPEFEAANSVFGYDFVQAHQPKPFTPMVNYPDGLKFRYSFRRARMVERGICQIQGSAFTALGNHQMEQVAFRLNVSFDPFVANITVKHVEIPETNSSACIFTCKAGVCPNRQDLIYDWAIYSTEWPDYNGRNSSSKRGNLAVKRNQLLIDGSECRALYAELVSDVLLGEYQVSCRIMLPTGQWSQKSQSLKQMLLPLFDDGNNKSGINNSGGDDEMMISTVIDRKQLEKIGLISGSGSKKVKESLLMMWPPTPPPSIGYNADVCGNSTLNCHLLPTIPADDLQLLQIDAHPCDENRCVFRCTPLCGNKFCIDQFCVNSNNDNKTAIVEQY